MNDNYDILDYIRMRGDLTFEESDFNSIDALILSQLCYNNIDGLVPSDFSSSIALSELIQLFKNAPDYQERRNLGAMVNELTLLLLEEAGKSRRFGQIKLSSFVNIIDEEKIEQFSATTWEIQNKSYVISFRGTDDTLVAWYEDFNLGYMKEIPAQKAALSYVNEALKKLKGTFILTGHSKGGNLAVKAALAFSGKRSKKLKAVYNFDGPGFSKDFYQTKDFLQLEDKIHSFFPEFCVVGMMFEHTDNYMIVNCSKDGILMHDPFAWNVNGRAFEQAEKFDSKSLFFHESFNLWTKKMTEEQRKKFIDVFFSVMYASGARTNYEIDKNKIVCAGKMLGKLAELSEDDRNAFLKAIKQLIEIARDKLPMISIFAPGGNFNKKLRS